MMVLLYSMWLSRCSHTLCFDIVLFLNVFDPPTLQRHVNTRYCMTTVDQMLAKLPAAPPTYQSRLTVCCSGKSSSICMALPTRSSPVLTTMSWAAVTDVKSHYPNAAISLTRSWVNEFVEMCDPFLIR